MCGVGLSFGRETEPGNQQQEHHRESDASSR
jgi:hypothetical protein